MMLCDKLSGSSRRHRDTPRGLLMSIDSTASTATTADEESAGTRRSRAARIGLWTLQVLLALMFAVGSGAPKLLGESYAVQIFAEMGTGQWLRIVVGLLEVAGGVGLLVPRL